MTVTNTQTTTGAMEGNGATTAWPYAFEIPDADSVAITIVDTTVTPATTTELDSAQYSITGLGTETGGTVTYPLAGAALAIGQFITVAREASLTQPTALANQGPFFPTVVEGAIDRMCLEIQQLATLIENCLQVEIGDPGGPPIALPVKSIRANHGLAFDANGDPIAGTLASVPVSAAMIPVFQAVTIAAALVALGGPFAPLSQWPPRNYTSVPVLSNNAGTPNSKLDVTAGACADSTNAKMIVFGAGTIDCGTVGLNGLDAGALGANTWYHAFAICKADGSGGGFIASTSPTTPTMPATYTLKRRLGSFSTDGSSHILGYTQWGDQFLWKVPILDVNAAAIGLVTLTPTLSLPLGVKTIPILNASVFKVAVSPVLKISSPDTTAAGAGAGTPISYTNFGVVAGANSLAEMTGNQLRTNTSSKVNFDCDVAASTYSVATYGWYDDLGRSA